MRDWQESAAPDFGADQIGLEDPSGVVVIGVGNDFRSDDAVGRVVARALRAVLPAGVRVVEHSGEGAGLMQTWDGASRAVIIDAVSSGAPPGTIHRVDCSKKQIPTGTSFRSGHAFGVAEGVATARALSRLPAELILFGVEAGSFDPGTTLSDPVRSTASFLPAIIAEELLRR